MKFLIILCSNTKRLLKNKSNIIASFVVPIAVILLFAFIFTKIDGSENNYAVILSDKGSYGEEFVSEMKKTTELKIYDKNDALERVKKKRLSAVYEVPENFTEQIKKGQKPQIISYKVEKSTEPGDFQFNANSVINKMMLREEFKNSGHNVSLKSLSYKGSSVKVIGNEENKIGDVIILNMIISFALYGAIGISMELFELKKQNILSRSFTTANKPGTIIGGVLGALFIVSSIAYSGAFLLSSYIFSSSNLKKAPVIVLNIVCLVMVALSIGVFITRIVKNENLINMVLQIIIALTCFIGGSFMPIEFLPKGITMFSKFTPQYWALQSINTGNAWLSIIVLMFSIVLFTCGTFKAKNFI
jgi:ABC-2 type transport system permease protein